MKVWRLELTVEEPAVLSHGTGSRNSTACHDHIPGSAIRGALAARYAARFGIDAHFKQIFEGANRFGQARPSPGGVPLFRRPLSRRTCTTDPSHYSFDLVAQLASIDPDRYLSVRRAEVPIADPPTVTCPVCNGKLSVQPGWEYSDGRPYETQFGDSTRTAMEDGKARKGALFAQSDLPRGAEFTVDIMGPDVGLLARLDLEGGARLRVGRSLSTNGALTITGVVERELEADTLDDELSGDPGLGQHGLALVLASPTILIDPFLRPTDDPSISLPGYELIDRFVDNQEVLGWNSGQGLPKAPDPAVSAGSVFVFRKLAGDDYLSPEFREAALRLATNGIGLRRQEGFGEVHIAPPNLYPAFVLQGARDA